MRLTVLCLLAVVAASLSVPVLAEDEDGLEEIDAIVVTITKRAESIQDVAASVSAFDDQMIREVNIEAVSDIATLIPGVVTKGEDRTGAISIRGVSSGFTGQAAVARHVNGVFKRFPLSYSGQYYDLDGIQLQRGPQGTVYGRNATAGTLNLEWKKPTPEWEVFGDVTYGNYDLYHVRGGVNVPFLGAGDDRLLGRFVFQREIRDGYLDNEWLPDSRDPQDKDEWSVRGSISARLSEDLSIIVRGFWVESDAEPNTMAPLPGQSVYPIGRFEAIDPLLGPGAPFDIFNGLQGAIQHAIDNAFTGSLLGFLATGFPGPDDQNIRDFLLNGLSGLGVPPLITDPAFFTPAGAIDGREFFTRSRFFETAQSHLEFYGVDGELSWHIGEAPILGDVEFIVSGGWEWLKIDQVTDADGTELPVVDSESPGRNNDSFTWDARLVTTGQAVPVDLVLGAFYFQHNEIGRTDSIVPFGVFSSTRRSFERGEGLYASGIIHLAGVMSRIGIPDLITADLLGGIRYNRDEEFLDLENFAAPPLRDASELSETAVFHEVTWEAGARVFVGEDHTIYGKFSKGYKPGFQQIILQTAPATSFARPVEPEIIRAIELGWKSTWLDGRLTANLSWFDYSYTNLQVPQLLNLQVVTANAAGASTSGVELEVALSITPEWRVTANAGYLDATYDEFCSDDPAQFFAVSEPGCPASIGSIQGESNLAGFDLEDAPEWKFSFLSVYTFDLGEWGTLTPIVKFTWTDDYFLRPYNLKIDEVDAYTRTDVRLQWRSAEGAYSAEIFVENLEDERVFARTTVAPDFAGGFAASLGGLAPRVYGVRLGFHWVGSE